MTSTDSVKREREYPLIAKWGELHYATTTDPDGYTWYIPPTLLETKSIADAYTPNYATRIEAGEIINNPCRIQHRRWWQTGSCDLKWMLDTDPTWYWVFSGDGYTASRDGGGIPTLQPDYDVELLERSAKLTALANIDGTPFEFGEDVGEIFSTLGFLREPLTGLAGLGKKYRKRAQANIHLGLPEMEALTNAWLTVRFAVIPLVRSLGDVAKASVKDIYDYPDRLSARGYASAQSSVEKPDVGSTQYLAETLSADIDFHANILYSLTNPARDWRWRFGLRGKDLPSTVWALMPLSFMVDRVVNIGQSIKGLINLASPEMTMLAASCRFKEERNTLLVTERWDYDNYIASGFPAGDHVHVKDFVYDRQIWEPSLQDIVPPFDLGGLTRNAVGVTDLIALVLSRFGWKPERIPVI